MNFERLTAWIDSLGPVYGVPAADCRITREHETVYRHMAGCADEARTIPLTDRHLFRLYSATKIVTMTAVLQLIEQGRLGLYDEVRRYLPEYDRMMVADFFEEESIPRLWPTEETPCHLAHQTIRIIDLMSMTAGMSYDTGAKTLLDLKKETGGQADTRTVVARMARLPLIFEPRTRWAYSLGHDVLAAVVEVISGMRFSEYLRRFIFDPLEITDFYFHWKGEHGGRVCAMYMADENGAILPEDGRMSGSFQLTDRYESGGAGLVGSVDAYSTFADALCNGGIGKNGARILAEETVKLFGTSYTTGRMSVDFAKTNKPGYEYGLGVRVLKDASVSRSPAGEFGWDGAAGAYVLIDPVNHISIFYAQHVMGFAASCEIHTKIRDLAYEAMGL